MQVFYQVVDFFRPSWVLMENVQDIMTKVGSSHHMALKYRQPHLRRSLWVLPELNRSVRERCTMS